LVLSNQAAFGVHNELSAASLAAMMLFASMNMPIFLELLRTARWTRVSHDHTCLLASLVSASGSGQPYQDIVFRALPL
jgi:hypothetical protein